jgi:hypothetical protein
MVRATYATMAELAETHDKPVIAIAKLVSYYRIPTVQIGGRKMVIRADWEKFLQRQRGNLKPKVAA